MRSWVSISLAVPVLALAGGCDTRSGSGRPEKPTGASAHAVERWPVTAWGERYEVFAETDPLAAGATSGSGVHVTVIEGFAPLTEGAVSAILRGPGGDTVFTSREISRPGIFRLTLEPPTEGEFALLYRVAGPAGEEEIPAGRVRVGSAAAPGGPVLDEAQAGGVTTSFLKEQQWRTAFATAWATRAAVHGSVRGPARVLPARGGEVVLTAPVAAIVRAARWPYPGMEVKAGQAVLSLQSTVPLGRSVAELEAAVAALEGEHGAATRRATRLDELFRAEATSVREVDEARAWSTSMAARLDAAHRDLAVARASLGGGGGEAIELRAPFAGQVASVAVTSGEAVGAGEPLVRLVRTQPVWLEVSLAPTDAARLAGNPVGVVLRSGASRAPFEIGRGQVRLVARAPEVDSGTGSVRVLLEVDRDVETLPLGSVADADVLLPDERSGVVVPATAVVDDAGVTVVFVQREGESFERRTVQIEAREGSRALVAGLRPGDRVVTVGGQAIRRAELLSSGNVEGHVH